MVKFVALVVGFLLGGLSVSAYAIEWKVETRLGASASAACEAWATTYYVKQYFRIVGGPSVPLNENTNGQWENAGLYPQFYCEIADNSTYTQGRIVSSGVQYRTEGCPTGQHFDSVTGQCQAPPCDANQTGSMRLHTAWTTSWSVDARFYNVSKPTTGCNGSCQATVTGMTDEKCFAVDNGGAPYPVYCWYSYKNTGSSCTASDPSPSDTPPPQSCPTGTQLGYVNDKAGCYPVTETTSTQTTTNNPDGSTTKVTTITNPDGSKTTVTETCDAAGNCSKTSTTTPATGPSNPGGTSDGGGTEDENDIAGKTCENQPELCSKSDFCKDNPKSVMCSEKAKIDDEGMTKTADFSQQKTALDEAFQTQENNITGESWKWTELGFVWNPQIPSGACSPVVIYGKSIDVCYALTRAREFWGWVIYMVAALAIWMRGTRAVGTGK